MLLQPVAVVAGVPLRLETVVERLVAVLVLLIKVVLVRLVQVRVLAQQDLDILDSLVLGGSLVLCLWMSRTCSNYAAKMCSSSGVRDVITLDRGSGTCAGKGGDSVESAASSELLSSRYTACGFAAVRNGLIAGSFVSGPPHGSMGMLSVTAEVVGTGTGWNSGCCGS